MPSWPYWLLPQQWAVPSASTAQLWRSPPSMATTPVASFITAVGRLLLAVVPVPSWPQRPLAPAEAAAAHHRAGVAAAAPTRAVTGPKLWMATGWARPGGVVPNPSWPESPRPQHHITPSPVTAQA